MRKSLYNILSTDTVVETENTETLNNMMNDIDNLMD